MSENVYSSEAVSKHLRGHLLEEGIWLQRAELGAKDTGGERARLTAVQGGVTLSAPSSLGTILIARFTEGSDVRTEVKVSVYQLENSGSNAYLSLRAPCSIMGEQSFPFRVLNDLT